jgi:hypothetical protein
MEFYNLNHYNHPYINNYSINTFIMNMSILCYTMFRFYVLLESDNKKQFIDNKIVFNDKNYFKFLIKTKLRMTFNEQIVFRVFLVELMSLFMSEQYVHPIWCFIFASHYFHNEYNIYIKVAKFIHIFLISYFVLFNVPFLASLLIHFYAELFVIIFTKFLHNNFDVQIIKIKKTDNLATKEEVEAMLNAKKIN